MEEDDIRLGMDGTTAAMFVVLLLVAMSLLICVRGLRDLAARGDQKLLLPPLIVRGTRPIRRRLLLFLPHWRQDAAATLQRPAPMPSLVLAVPAVEVRHVQPGVLRRASPVQVRQGSRRRVQHPVTVLEEAVLGRQDVVHHVRPLVFHVPAASAEYVDEVGPPPGQAGHALLVLQAFLGLFRRFVRKLGSHGGVPVAIAKGEERPGLATVGPQNFPVPSVECEVGRGYVRVTAGGPSREEDGAVLSQGRVGIERKIEIPEGDILLRLLLGFLIHLSHLPPFVLAIPFPIVSFLLLVILIILHKRPRPPHEPQFEVRIRLALPLLLALLLPSLRRVEIPRDCVQRHAPVAPRRDDAGHAAIGRLDQHDPAPPVVRRRGGGGRRLRIARRVGEALLPGGAVGGRAGFARRAAPPGGVVPVLPAEVVADAVVRLDEFLLLRLGRGGGEVQLARGHAEGDEVPVGLVGLRFLLLLALLVLVPVPVAALGTYPHGRLDHRLRFEHDPGGEGENGHLVRRSSGRVHRLEVQDPQPPLVRHLALDVDRPVLEHGGHHQRLDRPVAVDVQRDRPGRLEVLEVRMEAGVHARHAEPGPGRNSPLSEEALENLGIGRLGFVRGVEGEVHGRRETFRAEVVGPRHAGEGDGEDGRANVAVPEFHHGMETERWQRRYRQRRTGKGRFNLFNSTLAPENGRTASRSRMRRAGPSVVHL
mmetsp:Transcript_39852/g.119903  ORF Transcript_39852/g.119903 Transcript_39852/m.119903 type:complete len:705 (+) Transcript_39852:989-3103(+)